MDSEPSNHVPAIYVAKYNRFVDNILGRINKILRTNYDPVTVKLTNPNSSSKVSKNKSKNKSKRKSNKKGSKRTAVESTSVTVEKLNQGNSETVEKIMESTDNMNVSATPMEQVPTTSEMVESRSSTDVTKTGNRQKAGTNKKSNKNRNGTKNKTKTQTGTNNKNKKKSRSKPKARATLYGLASLQRSGNVSVNMMSDHTTIKTKFTLGPLVLKVEKEFGRAAKRELRSATATTAEMSGKLSLRVLHGGAATLNSIRVLQPKQVRVESADDHDRTREFVWKRSSHIAHLVSQKLSSATRSMLQPPPEVANAA